METAFRLVEKQVRALQVGLETDIKSHIPFGIPVITWPVRHAAMVRTMRAVGADGKTGWQRALWRGYTIQVPFPGRWDVEIRVRLWCIGVWFDKAQNGIRHIRILLRMPDVRKFDRGRIAAISSTPWSIHEAANPDGVVVEKSIVKEDPGTENVMKARKMHIRQADLDAFGYTPGCKRCQSILGRGKGETSTPHSETCRARIMAEMAKTDGGIVRLSCVNEHARGMIHRRTS